MPDLEAGGAKEHAEHAGENARGPETGGGHGANDIRARDESVYSSAMRIIDFHNHYYPPEYLDALGPAGSCLTITHDQAGNPVHIEADGKIDNLGSYNRSISGTWTQGTTKGDFKVTRD